MQGLKLCNGVEMPQYGFGTFKYTEEQAYETVKMAIESGYRYIDSAYAYYNEKGTGRAIKECIEKGIVTREDLFICTKVRPGIGYYGVLKEFQESLDNLQLDYLDLVLIHNPSNMNKEWKRINIDMWCALEKLYAEQKIRVIGVSNFKIEHLYSLIHLAKIKPMVNQIELHPACQQKELVKFCQDNDIAPTAWSSLNQGNLNQWDATIAIAKKYNKTIAQILLRWGLQKGFVPLSRSSSKQHIDENLNIFDFEISQDDMEILEKIDTNQNLYDDWCAQSKWESTKNIYKYRLFGLLPFLSVKTSGEKRKYYLLGIPVLTVKKAKK